MTDRKVFVHLGRAHHCQDLLYQDCEMSETWIQLDGVEQILPHEGWEVEQLKRKLLDCLHLNGYAFVIPPLADFVETLLGGTDDDLDVLTVKAPDYMSGKLFGIRADMTPQIARMAAHHLDVPNNVVRLSYFGPTLLARAPYPGDSRELLQFGAELFGSTAPESDQEIIGLMIECLRIAGVESLSVSLGHVGIIQELFYQAQIDLQFEQTVMTALHNKSQPDLEDIANRCQLSRRQIDILCDLTTLNGNVGTIHTANSRLGGLNKMLDALLQEFQMMVEKLAADHSDVNFHVDYAQVGGYRYHTGIIFSAYGAGYGHALAKGGRYDDILSAYGTACPATGFSGDLRLLRQPAESRAWPRCALIPMDTEVPEQVIQDIKSSGIPVVRQLPDQNRSSLKAVCDKEVVFQDGFWKILPLAIGDVET